MEKLKPQGVLQVDSPEFPQDKPFSERHSGRIRQMLFCSRICKGHDLGLT